MNDNYIEDYDLEKEILATIIIDSKSEFIKQTIIEPIHFTNEHYKFLFVLFKKKYLEFGKLDYKDVVTFLSENREHQQDFVQIYQYAVNYVLLPDMTRFRDLEDKLLDKYKKCLRDRLLIEYQGNKIDYETLRNKLDSLNEDKCVKRLLDIADDIDDLTIDKPKKREFTHINQLDYFLKGLEYGLVYLWTGITNSGKTTLMTQISNEILKAGQKVFYFSGEQTSTEFKNSLYVSICSKDEVKFVKDKKNENIIDIIPTPEASAKINKFLRNRLYVYNNDISKNDINTMIAVMNEAYKLGVNVYFIDNFMQLDNSELIEQQTMIMEQFKRFARNKNVIVNLVAHPRKTQFSSSRLNIMDISGSQNIANKASSIITITRTDMIKDSEKEEYQKHLLKSGYKLDNCDAVLEVLKTKGNKNGCVALTYDRDFRVYKESSKVSKDEYEYLSKVLSKNKKRITEV